MGYARSWLAAVAALGLMAASQGVATGDPLFEPIKVEIPAPVDGTWDPFDPPLIPSPDPDVATLDVPAQH